MSESGVVLEKEPSPERDRYRLLLEVADRVARTQSLPDALKELAPPVLALTGGEVLHLSLHDPRRDCMLTHYWKKNRESGEFEALPVDEAASGWAWKHQEPIAIPDIEQRASLSRLRARVTQSRRPILYRSSLEHAFEPLWSIGPGQEGCRGSGQ